MEKKIEEIKSFVTTELTTKKGETLQHDIVIVSNKNGYEWLVIRQHLQDGVKEFHFNCNLDNAIANIKFMNLSDDSIFEMASALKNEDIELYERSIISNAIDTFKKPEEPKLMSLDDTTTIIDSLLASSYNYEETAFDVRNGKKDKDATYMDFVYCRLAELTNTAIRVGIAGGMNRGIKTVTPEQWQEAVEGNTSVFDIPQELRVFYVEHHWMDYLYELDGLDINEFHTGYWNI